MDFLGRGLQNMLGDVSFWVLLLIPLAAGAMIGYHAIGKMLADGDPGVIADKNKAMKRILVAAVIGESASALVTGVISYFR